MFGISLTKLLVLIAIIAAVWYGFKAIGRLEKAQKARVRVEKPAPPPKSAREEGAQEMIQCPKCGSYVPSGAVMDCGREGCPYSG